MGVGHTRCTARYQEPPPQGRTQSHQTSGSGRPEIGQGLIP
jgi:hypothetical protein